ncbi:hypothetical protein [Aquabacterium sp.]|uniref:hypothetical protein n=1 Tax=Aquabacterium sp. TaxID=1872578 RepID=UPI0035B30367
MHRAIRPTSIALACICAWAPPAHAIEFFDDLLRVEGFGTLGAFSSDLDSSKVPTPAGRPYVDPQVRADVRESHGSTDNHVIYDADTSLSVQATWNPHGEVQGVLQLLSKQNIHASQKPQVEWAYLGWQAAPTVDLKFGRVVAPIFMLSDARNVAYSQTMVRPFTSVYALNPITHLDGGNALWKSRPGPYKLELEGMFGRTSVELPSGMFKVPRIYGVSSRVTRGEWSVRAGASHLDVNIDLIPSAQARLDAAINIDSPVLGPRTGLTDQKLDIFTLGGQWEHDNLTVLAEFANRQGTTLLAPSYQSYYVLGSWRFNAWTPYVAWGRARNTESPLGLHNQTNSAAIADLEDARVFGRPNRTEQTVGVRWDFMPKAALKAQWTQLRQANPRVGAAGGQVQYYIPNDTFGGTINTYALNLDFIF